MYHHRYDYPSRRSPLSGLRDVLVSLRRFRLRARIGCAVTNSVTSPLTDPGVQISRTWFLKLNSLGWLRGPGTNNTRASQRIALEEMSKLIPVQGMPASPAIKPILPGTTDRSIELPETAVIRRPPVILVVALHFPIKGLLLLLYRIVPMRLAPGRHIQETAP